MHEIHNGKEYVHILDSFIALVFLLEVVPYIDILFAVSKFIVLVKMVFDAAENRQALVLYLLVFLSF